jgi:hypothetical protein
MFTNILEESTAFIIRTEGYAALKKMAGDVENRARAVT